MTYAEKIFFRDFCLNDENILIVSLIPLPLVFLTFKGFSISLVLFIKLQP